MIFFASGEGSNKGMDRKPGRGGSGEKGKGLGKGKKGKS
jgi:hypothetical protein